MDIEVENVHAIVVPILGEEYEVTLDDGTILGYADTTDEAYGLLESWVTKNKHE